MIFFNTIKTLVAEQVVGKQGLPVTRTTTPKIYEDAVSFSYSEK